MVNQPHRLRRNSLAKTLSEALDVKPEVAIRLALRSAFSPSNRGITALRSITIADYGGKTAAEAASLLNLSQRQYFRYRSIAIEAVACVIEDLLQAEPARVDGGSLRAPNLHDQRLGLGQRFQGEFRM